MNDNENNDLRWAEMSEPCIKQFLRNKQPNLWDCDCSKHFLNSKNKLSALGSSICCPLMIDGDDWTFYHLCHQFRNGERLFKNTFQPGEAAEIFNIPHHCAWSQRQPTFVFSSPCLWLKVNSNFLIVYFWKSFTCGWNAATQTHDLSLLSAVISFQDFSSIHQFSTSFQGHSLHCGYNSTII